MSEPGDHKLDERVFPEPRGEQALELAFEQRKLLACVGFASNLLPHAHDLPRNYKFGVHYRVVQRVERFAQERIRPPLAEIDNDHFAMDPGGYRDGGSSEAGNHIFRQD